MILADLVPNIGGLLGIFVCYSLIIFLEIIEQIKFYLLEFKLNFRKQNFA